jgi:hypothetical protein
VPARDDTIRLIGLLAASAYAGLILWLFMAQPRTMTEAIGGLAAGVGAYSIDARAFDDGLVHFRADRFVEARAAFARADPATRDALTQFYVAYSFYRQGWHRTHRDDALYREGMRAVDVAIALAPDGRLVVDDPDLGMRTADELKAELERGLVMEAGDFNPLRLLEARK